MNSVSQSDLVWAVSRGNPETGSTPEEVSQVLKKADDCGYLTPDEADLRLHRIVRGPRTLMKVNANHFKLTPKGIDRIS